jgi:leucyl aminopeptidase (aminopeptidase T)
MSNYEKTCDVIINNCLGIQKGENVIIITDEQKRKIGIEIFKAVKKITDSILVEIPVTSRNGEEPVKMLYKMLEKADVIIAPTTMSLSHTKAFVNARKKGARVASLPGITEKMFLNAIDVNYDRMSRLTKKLFDYFEKKSKVKVVTKKGTDVEFSIKGRKPMQLDGICHTPGGFINLPDGEMCIAPIEESMNGKLVFDLSTSPDHKTKWGQIGLLVGETVELIIDDGRIKSFNGGKKAGVMEEIISHADKNANCIAEFAIGTNERAKITGFILEDEKALGTIHFAFGSNVSLGGNNQSNLHLDAIMGNPDVYVDDVQIMRNGKILI